MGQKTEFVFSHPKNIKNKHRLKQKQHNFPSIRAWLPSVKLLGPKQILRRLSLTIPEGDTSKPRHGWARLVAFGSLFFLWPTWLGIPPNGGSKYGKNAERRIQVCWWVSPLLSEPPFSVVVWPIGFKYLPPTWRKWCKMRNICFQCVAKKSGHELILCFFVSPLSGDAIVFSLWISERKQQRHAKTTTLSKLPLNYIPRESKDQTLPIGW